MKELFAIILASLCLIPCRGAEWVVYEGKDGPGKGKQIVLLAGDEEYRSEEGLPMLGKILSQRHGFKCTVLFSQDAGGLINPNNQTNVPGMQAIDSADLVIMQFRFRELPDADMKHFVDYLERGKPVIAIRTSTHAFQYEKNKKSPYAKWDWRGKNPAGGFGQEVLGDTWVSHHGNHKSESARGLINGPLEQHPILRGVKDVWGPSDVYGIIHLKPEDKVLLYGLTLKAMEHDSLPNYEKSIMPITWLRDYKWPNGNTSHTMTSTIGAAIDLESEDLRRMYVNACYSLTGLEVPKKADVTLVGEYKPTFFGFNSYKKGVKVEEHELR
jgi:type 1 glutamine amidotransferase